VSLAHTNVLEGADSLVMGFPTEEDCSACAPDYLKNGSMFTPAVLVSSVPLIATFLVVFLLTAHRLVPILSSDLLVSSSQNAGSVLSAFAFKPASSPSQSSSSGREGQLRRISTVVVATAIGLASVLAELVLCELSNTLNVVARGNALRGTIVALLFLVIAVIPFLEIHAVVRALGWSYGDTKGRRSTFAWVLHGVIFGAWLLGFLGMGKMMLARHDVKPPTSLYSNFSDTLTAYVGVIGISLMALLSGFASVSSPWQSFFARPAMVTEATLARKQAGLDSADEMLNAKRSRLRALERKMASAQPQKSLLEKAASTFRSSSDSTERKTLEMEISGLENMSLSLSTSHKLLSARYGAQNRAKTPSGRTIAAAESVFAIYCLYRIVTTVFSILRRRILGPAPFDGIRAMSPLQPHPSTPPFDPINALLSLLAPSSLDPAALSRQITFLLSGLMLLASFSSVLQTFHLCARFAPSLLRAAQANLPLIVAQVCGTYVISVALLLRGRMGGGTEGERLRGVGGGELGWVDGWFEGWFLAGAMLTAFAIWFGRKVLGGEDWDDEGGDVEMGKRS